MIEMKKRRIRVSYPLYQALTATYWQPRFEQVKVLVWSGATWVQCENYSDTSRHCLALRRFWKLINKKDSDIMIWVPRNI